MYMTTADYGGVCEGEIKAADGMMDEDGAQAVGVGAMGDS